MRRTLRDAAALARYKLGAARKAFLEQHPNPHAKVSYAQEGEDRILLVYFGGRGPGFYVDVGAHHPHRFSNTQLFNELGWTGINIDADPDAIRVFDAERPEDVNLWLGVGAEPGTMPLYVFRERALNTFDRRIALERSQTETLLSEQPVEIRTLAGILDEHLPPGRGISFLTVDAEGRDLDVLASNDWDRYRPELVLAESLQLASLEEVAADPVHAFLGGIGYALWAKTFNTLIFARERPV